MEECAYEKWYVDSVTEELDLDAEERRLVSDELRYEAVRLFIPIPVDSDEATSPRRYLTPKAMTELRAAIRKEHADRRAVFEWWLKVLGGAVGILTGLVGALIGLVAIWKK